MQSLGSACEGALAFRCAGLSVLGLGHSLPAAPQEPLPMGPHALRFSSALCKARFTVGTEECGEGICNFAGFPATDELKNFGGRAGVQGRHSSALREGTNASFAFLCVRSLVIPA